MSYYGTNRDDFLDLSVEALAGNYVNGRRGYDVLALSSDGDYSFSRASYYRMRKIEEIDFSGVAGALDIVVSGSMLRQAHQSASGARPISFSPSMPTIVPIVWVPWLWSSHGTSLSRPQGLGPLLAGFISWMASCQL